jgi:hypothetical protein
MEAILTIGGDVVWPAPVSGVEPWSEEAILKLGRGVLWRVPESRVKDAR